MVVYGLEEGVMVRGGEHSHPTLPEVSRSPTKAAVLEWKESKKTQAENQEYCIFYCREIQVQFLLGYWESLFKGNKKKEYDQQLDTLKDLMDCCRNSSNARECWLTLTIFDCGNQRSYLLCHLIMQQVVMMIMMMYEYSIQELNQSWFIYIYLSLTPILQIKVQYMQACLWHLYLLQ